jgi:Flp pilus assembly protein protease CpaA
MSRLIQQFQLDLLLHAEQYRFYLKAAAVAVLVYVGFTDFRTFKIRNDVLSLLLVLYVLYALVSRSWFEIIANVVVAAIMFGVLLHFYAQRVIGGADVKLVPIVCLWVGLHCVLPFAGLLLLFIGLHLFMAWKGWAQTKTLPGRSSKYAIAYAPSLAAALIGVMVIGCV